ncbi:MAG: hypothetical protein Q9201_004496 [Fulgogasparrea decipioides]
MDDRSGSNGPSSAFESPTFEENASFRLDKPVGSASISPCGRDIVLASYVHCWDLRHPSRAAMTFCDWFAGATQVKWNRQDSHILASSHNRFLRIWDDRKGAYPLRSIQAHATKIYGVDWNRTETNFVATCSLDKTIKFWDYTSNSDTPESTIDALFPVWRARHTPFGTGLLAMPQRDNYDLHLYDRRPCDHSKAVGSIQMVHRFDGHEGQVKEFLWRARGSIEDSRDSREFQLVSWGTDRVLRLHRVDEEVLGKVGYVRGQQVKRVIPFTRKDAVYRSFRGDPSVGANDVACTGKGSGFSLDFSEYAGMDVTTGAGMGKEPFRDGGLWASGGNPLISMAGRNTRPQNSVDAISWMKGVKIGKRETLRSGLEQSVSSILSPNLKSSQPWDTFDTLAEEITYLADIFSKVTFEESCEECLLQLRAVPEKSSLEYDQQPDLSSSDEEDEGQDHYAGIQVSGLESSNGSLGDSKTQYNVPLPKACGALWADDGRLVCFFLPKAEKAPSFLQPLSIKASEWTSKNRKNIFDGFGRLQSGSPITQRTASDLKLIEHGDSDFDDSSQSSSSSSSSDDVARSQSKMMPSIAWREALQGSKHAMSVDESQISSGANEQAQTATQGSRNFVSVHDCAELLPAKRSLALAYALNKGEQCCFHNGAVARRNGELDLADVWEFIDLIIKDEVPLDFMSVAPKDESILVVARRAKSPLHSKDSAIDLSYDSHNDEHQAGPKGPIYWGSHPFGRRWLVDALFDYFKQSADIQMLAMLSCVLRNASSAKHLLEPLSDDSSSHKSKHYLDVATSHPQFLSERYFPSVEVATSMLQPSAKRPAFTIDMQKPASDPHSTSSSIGASTSDPLTPFSTGLTPPSSSKLSKANRERSNSQITMSTSPELYKHIHRSSSNLATAFAASITRPFSFSTPDSSSPPPVQPKRRSSPATSYLGAATSNPAWGPSMPPRRLTSNMQGSKLRVPPSNVEERYGIVGGQVSSFTTKLKNQNQFNNDGYAPEPLLDPSKEEQYLAYRSMYARMLIAWNLSVASCEILQYNDPLSPPSIAQGKWDQAEGTSLIEIGRDTSEKRLQDRADVQLELRKSCSDCDALLPYGPESQRCPECSTTQAATLCQLCHCVISGLSSPCLNCGHVLHLSCRLTLQEDENTSLNGECVTGCGCCCADHLSVDVKAPPARDENTPLISASNNPVNEQEELGWQDVSEDIETNDGGVWTDVAYESLARNLGGKSLTPKPSQIWRGGEKRKSGLAGFPATRRSDTG